ncbi:MAG: hypothetical protein JSV99_08215, partial [Planctomycetota bacterium]
MTQPNFIPEQLEPRLLLSAVCDVDDELARPVLESYQSQIPAIVVERVPADAGGSNLEEDQLESSDDNPVLSAPLQEDIAEGEVVGQEFQAECNLPAGETEDVLSVSVDVTNKKPDGIDSNNDSSVTEQLIETLLAANPPPARQVSDLYFIFETQPGNNDLTLRLNPQDQTILELVDNVSADVLASRALADISKIAIYGSDEGDDTLTVDFSSPFWVENGIEYHGGDGWFDSLVFIGNEFLDVDYTAIGTDSGVMAVSDRPSLTTISFTGLEPVYVGNAASYTFQTSAYDSGVDDLTIDVDTAPNPVPYQDVPAENNRISGYINGIEFESVTFFNITSVTIDTGDNDTSTTNADRVTIQSAGLIAAGLQNFTITSGIGDDVIIIEADSLVLPVSGGGVSVDGGDGDDTLMTADIGTAWNVTASTIGNFGGVDFSSIEGLGVANLGLSDFLVISEIALSFQAGGILGFHAASAILNLAGVLNCSIADDGSEAGDDIDNYGLSGTYNWSLGVFEFTADEIYLEAFGLMIAEAGGVSFRYQSGSLDVNVDGGDFDAVNDDDLADASLLTVAADSMNLFVGAGGSGFSLTGGQLALARLTPNQTDIDDGDGRSYLAMLAMMDGADLLGVPGLTASASAMKVQINQAYGSKGTVDAVALDWTAALDLDDDDVFGEVEDAEPDGFYEVDQDLLDPGVSLGLTGQELAITFSGDLLAISGSLELSLMEFVMGNASFAFATRTIDVDLNGDESFDLLSASLMTIGLSDGNLFIGLSGEDDGTAGTGVGFEITGAQLSLALIKPSQTDIDGGDGRSYLAVKASLGTATLLGISDFDADADDLILKINQASGSNGVDDAVALDWTKAFDLNGNDIFGEPADWLDPGQDLDPQVDLTLDYTGQMLQVKSGFNIVVSDYFYVNGEFAFEKSLAPIFVTLTNHSIVPVDMLIMSAGGVDAFVGVNGPGDQDGAMGLSLSAVDFALMLMRSARPMDSRSWTALKAEVGTAEFVGVDGLGLTLEITDFAVMVNIASEDSGAVINFAASDFDDDTVIDGVYIIDVGTETIEIDFAGQLLEISGEIEIGLDGFVHLSGDLAFKRSSDPVTVTLDAIDDPSTPDEDEAHAEVEIMTVAAKNATAFAGVNGPVGQIDTMGLSLSGVDIGLVLMKVSDPLPGDTRNWMALKAELGSAEFVGVEDVTISLTEFLLLFNKAGGGASAAVNFAASEIDGDGAYSIDVGGKTIEIDFVGDITKVGGTVDIGLFGFVYLSGEFVFEKRSLTVPLILVDDPTGINDVEMLT